MTLDSGIVKQEWLEGSTLERPSQRDQRGVLSFPPFRLDLTEERLWKNGRELRLRPKPFAILRYLTRHPRRLVRQSEIVDAVWGRIAMSESLVRTHVRDLRHALGEEVIETVVGRGYRFLADVSEADETGIEEVLAGKPPLEFVRASESPSPCQAAEAVLAVRAADDAQALKALTDVLTTLGAKAVLLFIGDEQGERVATAFGSASTEQSLAVRLPVPELVAAAGGREERGCRRGGTAGTESFPASEPPMRVVKDEHAVVAALASHVAALSGT
jgi:DNA-binding winged helix-turn-helix (wHTH) protein